MLNQLIRASLRHRLFVLVTALLLFAYSIYTIPQLPVEVLPDLTKPTVTILTECPGLAPEEVETLVTQPIENAVQGVSGMDRLRSSSDVGLSLVFVEFAWNADIIKSRQAVQERLQAVVNRLPSRAKPGLTPLSSLMGEVLLVGIRSKNNSIAPMELRTLAETRLLRRIQSIPGVAEVLAIGGGVKQLQIQPDLQRLSAHQLTMADIETAVANATGAATSGYLQAGPREIMVRNIVPGKSIEEIGKTLVKQQGNRSILLHEVAAIVAAPQIMRGDASIALPGDTEGTMGVVLSVDKVNGVDTLRLTSAIEAALEELRPTLPEGVEVAILFRQSDFIEHAIFNLKEAILHGAIMVAVVLLLFLLNFRTTAITLTAIPLSFAVSVLVFHFCSISVNSMTLGGLAVAIGMVVDDAIVDVENVYRRLKENARLPHPLAKLEVIARASSEVRSSILYATVLIIMVFVPLLALQALEGRLFFPIAMATIVSMAASFLVSLTVIPVLCSLVLRVKNSASGEVDTVVVRGMKWAVRHSFLNIAVSMPMLVLAFAVLLLLGAIQLIPRMGREFLPTFNEGSATISLAGPPGSSLAHTNATGDIATRILMTIPEVKSVGRRAGRAERDDHVMPVSVNEFDVEFYAKGRPRTAVFAEIREKLATIPGTFANVGQPIGHRLSHMLSGVSAKIAVKVFGPDLAVLRSKGEEVKALAKEVPGLTDVLLEPQVPLPQLKIEVDRHKAAAYGIQPGSINEQVSALLGGKPLGELRDGPVTTDLVVRLSEAWRADPAKLREMPLETESGQRIPLGLVAELRESNGPNVVNRENGQRRIVISANTASREMGQLVEKWQKLIWERITLPEGYFLNVEGEYLAEQAASRRILWSFSIILVAITLLLHNYFRGFSLAIQVLINLPLALLGSIYSTYFLLGEISVATQVGFIAVGGVAARNGIMMISHYLHLMRHEGEPFGIPMIIRGTQERLVPVLMTALSAGIALIPLVLAAHEPGKEILHPVAVAIVGGLISSTLLDLMVTPAVFLLFGRKAAEKALALGAPATH